MNNNAAKNILTGAFFLIGIVLILGVVFIIGKDKGFTQPKFKVSVLFRDVGGLIEGAPVQLAGVHVGTVYSIDFLDQEVQGRQVSVLLSIFDKYKRQLNHNVRFTIKTDGIIGSKRVEIDIDETGQPVDLKHPIIGVDPLNVQDLAEVFADAAQAFTKTSQDFNKVDVQELSGVLTETARSLSTTAKGVNQVLTEIHHISIKSKRLMDRLEQRIIDGNLFKVF